MDRKKKIIVVVVTLIFVGVLAAFVKMMLFPSNLLNSGGNRISIVTPQVDEKKIDRVTKIEEYSRDKLRQRDTTRTNFGVFGGEDQITTEQDSIVIGEGSNQQEGLTLYTVEDDDEDEFDEELKGLIELQEQLLTQAQEQQEAASENNSNKELESLLQTYDDYVQRSYSPLPPPPEATPAANNGGIEAEAGASGGISEATKKADERLSNSDRSVFSGAGHFQGAGAINQSDEFVGLIPAETVDTSVLINGSTIAIRTKKEIRLKQPALFIPKGAVVYGRVSFSSDRVFVDIASYKNRNKLYPLNFKMFDFDGREGIHLRNRTWARIPSKVAEDVYDFIYQRGTQAAAFGGAQEIDLEDARDIAVLSAAREVSREVFDKRRVFMPKKYHLWLNVNGN